jgi:uncharacterized protein (TIGR02246 family)
VRPLALFAARSYLRRRSHYLGREGNMMKSLPVLALVWMSAVAGCATQQPFASAGDSTNLSAQDEAAVRATLAGLDAAWNGHDMQGLHELFADDGQWVRSSGNIWRSRDRIYSNYEFGPQSPPLHTENIELRPVAPQVAVAVAIMKYGEGELPSVGKIPAVHLRVSVVMVKRGATWKILQLHEAGLLPVVEENDELWGKAGSRKAGQAAR